MAASLVNIVEDKLSSLIKDEFGLLWGLNKEMEKLKSNFSAIQAVLQDTELKQHLLKGQEQKAIKDWLRKLNDVAYQLDDILDDCATESSGPDWLKKVCLPFLTNCFPFGFNLLFSLKIAHRMKIIRERLDEIAQERTKFHLSEMVVDKRVGFSEINRQTISIFTESEVYGREEDKEKIVEVLINHVSSGGEDLLVCPIIGMGGLGKTTLAQLVFNDARMDSHFQSKIWVCVSDPFDVQRILKEIIEAETKSVCQLPQLDILFRLLQDTLKEKRYLLVLDDVWNENQGEWDNLKCILKECGAKGSSIITATRLKMVASIMGTHPSYELKGLSEGDCWLLFKQRAFGSEREERPNLVETGKEIVKKCAGVPLAAKALGGLMRYKKEVKDWVFVKDSEIWNLPQDENNHILPALKLSYYNLPLELRRCFAYCSVFEKDTEIEKTEIIHLWMANGFISSANGKREMEDIGNEIWNELYWRSFFQDVKEDESLVTVITEVVKVTFKMHDLMHDLAHSVMDEECQIMEVERLSNNMSKNRIRHLNLIACSAPLTTMPKELQNIDSLRTLLYTEKKDMYRTNSSELSLFENHGALRAFDARGRFGTCTNKTRLASSVGSLKHLRYLRVSSKEITTLPNSICSLWNLQTLHLSGCVSLYRLPENMRCLRNLRHLLTPPFLIEMPPFIGELTCLKTLNKFVVGERKGCGVDELRCLDLAGSLSIKHLERVGNWKDAKEANLIAKQNLHSLKLYWYVYNEEEGGACEQVLEALQPSSNLQKLTIRGFNGTHFPPWMNDYLPSLRYLELRYINCVEYIINDEVQGSSSNTGRGFPCLEYLSIYSLPNLRGFSRREEEGRAGPLFSRLRSLIISGCPKLTTWPKCLSALEELEINWAEEVTSLPDNLGNYTSLRSLSIDDCPKLDSIPPSFPRLTQLQSLRIWRCPQLEMRCKEEGEDWDKIAHVLERGGHISR